MSMENNQQELLDGLEAELVSLDRRRSYIAEWIAQLRMDLFGEQMVIEDKPNISSAWDY